MEPPKLQPRLVFDKPQFPLMPDREGARKYGNVDNRMEVLARGVTHHVAVAVPTGLFTLMRDVFKVPPEEDVSLSIDQIGERYVFSLMYGENLVDLWDYSLKSLPSWVFSRTYRL